MMLQGVQKTCTPGSWNLLLYFIDCRIAMHQVKQNNPEEKGEGKFQNRKDFPQAAL